MGLRNDATLGQPLATSGSAIGGRGRVARAGHCNHIMARRNVVKGLAALPWLSALQRDDLNNWKMRGGDKPSIFQKAGPLVQEGVCKWLC